MSLQSIKSEICQLLSIESISASEAKALKQASDINGNWSKTETWENLLNNIKLSQKPLESTTTDNSQDNDVFTINPVESIVEASSVNTIIVEPNYKSANFIDFILINKLWFYKSYKITDIKFPTLNKAVLYSDLLQDSFVITKSNNYSVAFKSVNQVVEDIRELFTFDWLKLANYYHELKENKLVSERTLETGKTTYRSIPLPRDVSKATQLLLNVANFKQENTGDKSSKSIKTFKDWIRVMYLELPEKHLETFLTGLTRNYSRQVIEQVKEAFTDFDRVTGKLLNNNARTGSMAFYTDLHTNRHKPGVIFDKKAVYLTRADERYTPTTEVYSQIKVAELFKLLDLEVDMSRYTKFAAFCGYWKLVVISHILGRTQLSVTNDWMRVVVGGLRLNGDVFGGYVLVEEIDNRRFNNKIRLTNDTLFKVSTDSSGKKSSSYMEVNKLKVIDRIEVKHSNMLQSHGRPKSVKNTNKGGKNANYLKLAETNNYELRLFYLEGGSKPKPHESFKEVLANLFYVEKNTSISNEIGQIWIKTSKAGKDILVLSGERLRVKQTLINDANIHQMLLINKRHVERLSQGIKKLRKEREDRKVKEFNLINERVITDDKGLAVSIRTEDDIAKELRGLIEEKLRYELQIKAFDLNIPSEIIVSLYQLGIDLLTDGIRPRSLDWTKIFSSLELEIPLIKDNAIKVIGNKHEQKTIS